MGELLTGFDVLNTTGGGMITEVAKWASYVFAVLLTTTMISLYVAVEKKKKIGLLYTAILAILTVCFVISGWGKTQVTEPVRYEVTLKSGAVIDAVRWNIIEQRGQIYVIEGRKVSE